MIIKDMTPETKYTSVGYYLTATFMIGDADHYVTSEYFTDNEQEIINIAFILENCDTENWREVENAVNTVAPDFNWRYDEYAQSYATFDKIDIKYFDGTKISDCQVSYEDYKTVPANIKDMCSNYWGDDNDDDEDE